MITTTGALAVAARPFIRRRLRVRGSGGSLPGLLRLRVAPVAHGRPPVVASSWALSDSAGQPHSARLPLPVPVAVTTPGLACKAHPSPTRGHDPDGGSESAARGPGPARCRRPGGQPLAAGLSCLSSRATATAKLAAAAAPSRPRGLPAGGVAHGCRAPGPQTKCEWGPPLAVSGGPHSSQRVAAPTRIWLWHAGAAPPARVPPTPMVLRPKLRMGL